MGRAVKVDLQGVSLTAFNLLRPSLWPRLLSLLAGLFIQDLMAWCALLWPAPPQLIHIHIDHGPTDPCRAAPLADGFGRLLEVSRYDSRSCDGGSNGT